MKNLFLAFTLLSLIFSLNSCSDDDKQESGASINPPSWIIGKWKSEPVVGHEFTFTETNFIFTQIGTSYNFSELSKSDLYSIKEIVKTSNTYQIDKTTSLGTSQNYIESYEFTISGSGIVTFKLSASGFGVPMTIVKVN